jgi:hypothetical protein
MNTAEVNNVYCCGGLNAGIVVFGSLCMYTFLLREMGCAVLCWWTVRVLVQGVLVNCKGSIVLELVVNLESEHARRPNLRELNELQ